ncbi:MAG TPA: 2-dehydropantoate 2-reductase N-terminal domain-containing protein [Acidimicrobiales bacterium]|nr:2-dehydropantoate 2-reductase N-terminal domain-containing protein [Acidimicrobiales bacterium]
MTRYIVYGAGAIGGAIGARLFAHGSDTVLIARGAHHDAIAADGLRVDSPEGSTTVRIPVVDHPARAGLRPGDVVLLTMKTQDTQAALRDLAACAPAGMPVVCAQNGVENERMALRVFPEVHGMVVLMPAAHLSPGVIIESSSPVAGILDTGRAPSGHDAVDDELAEALRGGGFESQAIDDVMAWKYRKLISNLGNAVQAVVGIGDHGHELTVRARSEGMACLAAAGISSVSDEDFRMRHGEFVTMKPVGGEMRSGGSSWQSLARGAGSVEADYLNGEIALLGRLQGVPTPVNTLLQRLANDLARRREPPGSMSSEKVLALLDAP